MFKYMLTFMAITRLSSVIGQNLNGMATFFQHYFAGTENLRIISIILLLLAFILFLFLIVILYIKSLLSFIKESEVAISSEMKKTPAKTQTEPQEAKEPAKQVERKEVKDLNKKPLVQPKERPSVMKKQEMPIESEKQAALNNVSVLNIHNVPPSTPKTETAAFRGNAALSEFDWRKGRLGELDEAAAGVPLIEKKIVKKGALVDYAGLILDMLGRGIDAGKIVQTIRHKTAGTVSQEDIIQSVDSIQNFISLANNGKFNTLSKLYSLEDIKEALRSLACGNAGGCLAILEDLIYPLIERATKLAMPQKRDIVFSETSNYACTFGSIAMMDGDFELAVSAFELAIELSPKNANAWSRVADAYDKLKVGSKAIWAYQNVISYASSELYAHQLANANQKLAKYYQTQGDALQAAKLADESNAYYQTIGIDLALTKKEQSIIELIEENQIQNIDSTVGHLLNFSVQKQAGVF
ncbi:MAG: hypothetical protein IJS26_00405 [Alphaproteobacteria bacterium]|nr:hypothetical protein [Alphaproteobacteria bacterium]